MAGGARPCQFHGELAFLGYEERVGSALVVKPHLRAQKVSLDVLELVLEGEDLLLEPIIERLELLYSGMIGVAGTRNRPVVALTEIGGGSKGHGVVACCHGVIVGSVVAFFLVGWSF